MDNAPIHKAICLKPLFEKINIFYGPPYSPFLNPIEEIFGVLKKKIRKTIKKGRNELIKSTIISLFEIK